jgi:hypothetical protein
MADAAPSGKPNAKAWFKKHKVPVLIGGGGVAVGAAYLKKKSSATAATAAAPTLAGQPCTDANGNASTTDVNGNCPLASTSAVDGGGPPGETGPQGAAGDTGATGATGPAGSTTTGSSPEGNNEFKGSGYAYVAPGSGKVAVVQADVLSWAAAHNFERWYEPTLGQYVDVKGHSLKPGTTQFITTEENTQILAQLKASDAKAAVPGKK